MPDRTTAEWSIERNPDGYFRIVDAEGCTIAETYRKDTAMLICQLPKLVHIRQQWASIINKLANDLLDGAGSNERDFAEEAIEMVLPYLEAEMDMLVDSGEVLDHDS